MPGVRSVVIVPRKPDDPVNQRVFIVTTDGAERYPILSLAPSPPAARQPLPHAPATSP
jgi:hypothetical protein